jgi:alanyl-tRNA synthetase
VARRDNVESDALRTLAQAVLRHDGVRAVVLGGSPDGTKVAIAAATGGEPDAAQLVRTLGPIVGGGGGGSPQLATAGGKNPAQIEDALAEAQRLLTATASGPGSG